MLNKFNINKVISGVLAITLMLSVASADIENLKSLASAGNLSFFKWVVNKDLRYQLNEESKNAVLKECVNAGVKKVVIPQFVIENNEGYNVTSVAEKSFYECNWLQSAIIPDNVNSIGREAFGSCRNLKSIRLSENLTSIEESTFKDCRSLEIINIPIGVTNIGKEAFWDCSALKEIKIPEGVKEINSGTFLGCSNLTSVEMSSNVKVIGEYAFWDCKNLKAIKISNNTKIAENSFPETTKIERY